MHWFLVLYLITPLGTIQTPYDVDKKVWGFKTKKDCEAALVGQRRIVEKLLSQEKHGEGYLLHCRTNDYELEEAWRKGHGQSEV